MLFWKSSKSLSNQSIETKRFNEINRVLYSIVYIADNKYEKRVDFIHN